MRWLAPLGFALLGDLAQAWAFARGVDNEDGDDEGGGGEERAGGGKKDVTWQRLNRVTQYGQFPNLDKLLFTFLRIPFRSIPGMAFLSAFREYADSIGYSAGMEFLIWLVPVPNLIPPEFPESSDSGRIPAGISGGQ